MNLSRIGYVVTGGLLIASLIAVPHVVSAKEKKASLPPPHPAYTIITDKNVQAQLSAGDVFSIVMTDSALKKGHQGYFLYSKQLMGDPHLQGALLLIASGKKGMDRPDLLKIHITPQGIWTIQLKWIPVSRNKQSLNSMDFVILKLSKLPHRVLIRTTSGQWLHKWRETDFSSVLGQNILTQTKAFTPASGVSMISEK